ncbi:MAG: serine/threonine-protein kinase [Myxococcaceae bacterium]
MNAPIRHEIEGFVLHAVLGEGGYGTVYRAAPSNEPNAHVALKVFDPSSFNNRTKAIERFHREIEAVSKLRHRAIVGYVGRSPEHRDVPFLVTELILGAHFRSDLDADSDLKLSLMIEVLSGLSHAHSTGVFHRDIKPSNLMVRASDGQIVILDFGMAFLTDDDGTTPLTTRYDVGTQGYIPPEVVARKLPARANQDIYAAAVTLYEAIEGSLPNTQSLIPLSSSKPDLGVLDPVISRALGPVEHRYLTAADFAEALDGVRRQLRATKTLRTSNPIAESLLARVRKQRQAEREQTELAAKRAQAMKEEWLAAQPIVEAGARRAFEDMLSVAQEVSGAWQLTELVQGRYEPRENPWALYALRHANGQQINFGITRGYPGHAGHGQPSIVGLTWGDGTPQSPRRQAALIQPQWVVYTTIPRGQMSQSDYRCVVGRARLLDSGQSAIFGRMTIAPLSPQELESSEQVRDLVTSAIGHALGI